MEYESRVTEVTVNKKGEPIFSEHALKVRIEDESGGEFIVLYQDGKEVYLDVGEWDIIKETIDKMAKECRI